MVLVVSDHKKHIRRYSCSCIRYFSDCPNSEWNYLMPLSWIVDNDVMNHFLKCLIPFFHNSGSFWMSWCIESWRYSEHLQEFLRQASCKISSLIACNDRWYTNVHE